MKERYVHIDVLFGQVQPEREAAFLNIKLHAARFRVCVGLLADRRITAAVCKQTLLQGGVVAHTINLPIIGS